MKAAALALSVALVLALEGDSRADELPTPRLRAGGSVGVGPMFIPGANPLFGIETGGRLGVQVSDAVGLYLRPTAVLGVGGAAIVTLGAGFVAEGTVGDRVAFGAGPAAAFIATLKAGDNAGIGPRGAVWGGRGHVIFYLNQSIAERYLLNGAPTNLVNRASYSLGVELLALTGSDGGFGKPRSTNQFIMILPTAVLGIDVF